ncbi:hypothetical protein P9112_000872 [Eukaryota sp. TZLM1-RC]
MKSLSREIITLQVGQCGNQIGWRFWDALLKEHDNHSFSGLSDASSTFFATQDSGNGERSLKARAVLVDTEERVLAETQKRALLRTSSIKTSFSTDSIFEENQVVEAQSGSGNNWADGYFEYGPSKGEETLEALRLQAEQCSSLQGVLMFHSVGGGTGSGLGSWIFDHLSDEFGPISKFAASVFPGNSDDVITSPYNSLLTLSSVADSADAVLVFDNQALTQLAQRNKTEAKSRSNTNPFDIMNNFVANAVCDFTSTMRFPGSLNVDIGEIATNLVPFPKLSFLTPTSVSLSNNTKGITRVPDLLRATYSSEYQLCSSTISNRTLLASALLGRGKNLSINDLSFAADQITSRFPLAFWAEDLVKVGLCDIPPTRSPCSALGLFNSCGVTDLIDHTISKFSTLFKRRAFLAHYEKWMTRQEIGDRKSSLVDIRDSYTKIEDTLPPTNYRIVPLK